MAAVLGTWHVHPSGTETASTGDFTIQINGFRQPPSQDVDMPRANSGMINIVVGARDQKVYFYNQSGVIGKPLSLNDFMKEK